jgi:hypothetical protein
MNRRFSSANKGGKIGGVEIRGVRIREMSSRFSSANKGGKMAESKFALNGSVR